jgi:hypothetical protein
LRDTANLRAENVLMLGVVPRRMLEKSDEARDLREERGILLAGLELVFR